MNRSGIFVCSVAFAGVTVLAMMLGRRDRALEADACALDAELAANHRLVLALQRRDASRHAETIGPGEQSAEQPSERKGRVTTAAIERTQWVTHALSGMPDYAPVERARFERLVMREYGEWLSQLASDAVRRRDIKQIMREFLEMRQAKYAAVIESGVDARSPEFAEKSKRDDGDLKRWLQQRLTPEEYASWKNFDATKGWVARIPELQMFLAERGIPPLSAAQRSGFVHAAAAGLEWTPPLGTANGPAERMRAEYIGEIAGRTLPAAQRDGLQAYIRYLTDRSKATAQILSPSAPDDMHYWGTPAF